MQKLSKNKNKRMRRASSLSKGFNYVKCLRSSRSEIDLDEAKQKKIEEEEE